MCSCLRRFGILAGWQKLVRCCSRMAMVAGAAGCQHENQTASGAQRKNDAAAACRAAATAMGTASSQPMCGLSSQSKVILGIERRRSNNAHIPTRTFERMLAQKSDTNVVGNQSTLCNIFWFGCAVLRSGFGNALRSLNRERFLSSRFPGCLQPPG